MYLKRRPREKLQPDEGVEQLWQAKADVGLLVGGVVLGTPCFELGLNAVDRIETLKDIFKHFAGLF